MDQMQFCSREIRYLLLQSLAHVSVVVTNVGPGDKKTSIVEYGPHSPGSERWIKIKQGRE
jgi:hypothetical protein